MAAGRVRVQIAAAGLALTVGVTGCTGSASKSSAAGAATAAGLSEAAGAPVSAAAAASSAAGAAAGTSAAASAAAASAAPAASGAAAAGTSAAATSAAAGGSQAPANNGLVENRPPLQTDPTAGRSIIYTATISLQVPTAHDVATTAEKIAQAAEQDGYVFSRNDQDAANNPPPPAVPNPATPSPTPTDTGSADLVLKVAPGGSYDGLITKIRSLGKTLDFNEKTSDVTSQVVDTQSRLTAQKASVARIRVLLDKATTIGQIVQVEGELTRREADLESLEGTLNVLKAQTALATITVHIEQAPPAPTPTASPKPTVPPKPKKHIHGFSSGLKAGSHSFVTGAVGVATVLGALLPYLALALVLALVAWFSRRSWNKSHRRAGPVEQVSP